jgi:DnaD/phage-associated family protein
MAEKKRSSFILLLEHIHTMEELTDEEFGQFVRAYAAYVETGADPEFSDRSMRMMWKTVKAFDKMNTQKYSSTSEARSEAGKRGMKSRWGAKSEDSKEKKVITNDNKNSKCYFVNNKNNLSVSDSVSVIPPIGGIERDVPAAVDMELSKIVQHYQQTIGDFPRSALDKLQKWRQEYSTEMILLAIDKAAEAGKRSWNYINGILSGWQRDGIQTPVDVLANEQSRQARPRGKQPTETVDDQLARVLAKMDRERGFET